MQSKLIRRFGAPVVGLAGIFVAGAPLQAAIIGSTVTGSLKFGSGTTNFFDPANGTVPASGYSNSSSNFNSPTVTISSTQSEYGSIDGSNAIIADFGSSTLLINDLVFTTDANPAQHYTFVDSAFVGLALAESNDTFPNGVVGSLVGDTLTVDASAFQGTGNYNAQFTLTSVPEPTEIAMLLLPMAALLHRKRTR